MLVTLASTSLPRHYHALGINGTCDLKLGLKLPLLSLLSLNFRPGLLLHLLDELLNGQLIAIFLQYDRHEIAHHILGVLLMFLPCLAVQARI